MASLKEKIGYALGDAAAGGITWKIMSIAFPMFFTNVFGLTFADAAILMLVARMFDVITDPLMGSLADRTKSKWGTYRPWLIFGAIPFGLIFALLLYTPDFDPVGKRIWAYTLYLLMMAVYTMVNVPYGSLLGVMTSDDDERNQFSSYRMVGAYAMGFIIMFAYPYVQNFIGGDEYVALNEQLKELKDSVADSDAIKEVSLKLLPYNKQIFTYFGIIFGALAALLTLACGFLTKERIEPKRAEKFSFKQFIDLFKNKPWLSITSVAVCTNFFNGFRYAVAAYMFTYCLNGDIKMGDFIINFSVLMGIGEALCMIFGGLSPVFTRMVGSKRYSFVWASLICLFTSVGYFFIPMDADYIWVIVGVTAVTSIGIGLYSPLLWSMYADVADYATKTFGASSTGLIFSSGTMAQKFGTAISGSLIAMLLGWAGLVSETDMVTGETIVTITNEETVRTMIWSLFSLFPAGIALIMAAIVYFHPIKK